MKCMDMIDMVSKRVEYQLKSNNIHVHLAAAHRHEIDMKGHRIDMLSLLKGEI